MNVECDTSHGQDSCKCDCTCTFLLRNLRGYVYAHRCFIDFSSCSTMQLFQVLELAASLFAPNFLCRFVLQMPCNIKHNSGCIQCGNMITEFQEIINPNTLESISGYVSMWSFKGGWVGASHFNRSMIILLKTYYFTSTEIMTEALNHKQAVVPARGALFNHD